MRIISGDFKDYYDPTIEDSYMKDNYMVDGEPTALEILDTAGQDTFIAMRNHYYQNMDGFVLVYSVTDKNSVADVEDRFNEMKLVRDPDNTGDLPPIVVVGNKCDMEDQRVVPTEEGENLAKTMGESAVFLESSAKANINIDNIFQEIVKAIKKQKAKPTKAPKKGNGCCCTII